MNLMHRDGVQRKLQQTHGVAGPRNPDTTNQRCVEEYAGGIGERDGGHKQGELSGT